MSDEKHIPPLPERSSKPGQDREPSRLPPASARSRGPWAAGIVMGVLALSLTAYAWQYRPSQEPSTPAPAVALDPGAAVDSAHAAAPIDSVIAPQDLPGFETEHLTDGQRLWLYHRAHLEGCTCGCGMTMAQCRVEDPTCPVSPGRAVEMVAEAERQPH